MNPLIKLQFYYILGNRSSHQGRIKKCLNPNHWNDRNSSKMKIKTKISVNVEDGSRTSFLNNTTQVAIHAHAAMTEAVGRVGKNFLAL